MHDLQDAIRDIRPCPDTVPPLDVERLHHRARRAQRVRTAAIGSAVVVAVLAAASGIQTLVRPPQIEVGDRASDGQPRDPRPTSTTDPMPRLTPPGAADMASRRSMMEQQLRVGREAGAARLEVLRQTLTMVTGLRDSLASELALAQQKLASLPEDSGSQREQLEQQIAQLQSRLVDAEERVDDAAAAVAAFDAVAPRYVVVIPDLVGLTEQDARTLAAEAGLEIDVVDGPVDNPAEVGRVIAQNLDADIRSLTEVGGPITLVIAVGFARDPAFDPPYR